MRLDRRLTTALLLIVLGALSGCLRTRGVSMDDWLGASYSRTYAAPTPAQAAALTAAFDAALLGQAEQPWSAVHYESWRWPDGFALRETAPPSLGWGAYVFRERPARAHETSRGPRAPEEQHREQRRGSADCAAVPAHELAQLVGAAGRGREDRLIGEVALDVEREAGGGLVAP